MTSFSATVLLCDAAQAADGKLYVMGGGWTRIAANVPTPVALAIVVTVPFDMTNVQTKLSAKLLDDDGGAVHIEGNEVLAEGQFEMGRPAGVKPGEQLAMPLAMSFQGISLEPGGYVFEVSIADEVVSRRPFRAV